MPHRCNHVPPYAVPLPHTCPTGRPRVALQGSKSLIMWFTHRSHLAHRCYGTPSRTILLQSAGTVIRPADVSECQRKLKCIISNSHISNTLVTRGDYHKSKICIKFAKTPTISVLSVVVKHNGCACSCPVQSTLVRASLN